MDRGIGEYTDVSIQVEVLLITSYQTIRYVIFFIRFKSVSPIYDRTTGRSNFTVAQVNNKSR